MPESVVVVVLPPNWLGDAVMETPFLKRLTSLHPGGVFDVLAKPSIAGVYAGMPGTQVSAMKT